MDLLQQFSLRSERWPAAWLLALIWWVTATLSCTAQTAVPDGMVGFFWPDVRPEHRSAFTLLALAERTVGSVFRLDDDVPNELRKFWILQPSTILALHTTGEVLRTTAEGLGQLEVLLEEDIAEELVLPRAVLAQLQVEEDEGLFTRHTGADLDSIPTESILTLVDVDIDLADGRCGDLEALVRVAHSEVVRSLGAIVYYDGASSIDPDRRLLALDALRAHHAELRQALSCMSAYTE